MCDINLKNLNTKYLGKIAKHYKTIDSTQKEIWRRVENNNIENGTIIIADVQTDAIGTHGRSWYTNKKDNIAFSFIIIPKENTVIDELKNLSIEIAEILVKIFKEKYNIEIGIKFPNDLIVNEKKLGGILTETKLQGKFVKKIVIGIGIDTNEEEIEDEIKNISTSIKKEFNVSIDNEEVISEFLNLFEKSINKKIKMIGE